MKIKRKKDIPSVRFEGSEEQKNKNKNKQKNMITARLLGIAGFMVVIGFILIFRLSYIQIAQEELYRVKLDIYGVQVYSQDASRGTIEDRDGVMLVDNTNSIDAVYFSINDMSEDDAKAIANYLYDHVEYDLEEIDERQRKDYFLIAFPDFVDGLISDEQKEELANSNNYDRDLYNLQISLITPEIMEEHMSDEVLFKTWIETTILQTTSGSATLLEGLSASEASVISTNHTLLKGIEIKTGWQRNVIHDDSFTGVLGRVSTQQTGLPSESALEFLSLGMSNDSRVGLSGLEEEYDMLLRGVNSTYSITTDDNGDSVANLMTSGTSGTNLRLTIDWELQELAEQEIIDALKANTTNELFTEMFLVIMDPNNGDILVMAGKKIDRETGEIYDYADGAYKSAYLIGSTTKGGTIYSAYKHDLTYPGEIIIDEPMKIQGTKEKSSWTNLGAIDDITALARSSNIFMFEMAIRLGGGSYAYNQPLVLDYDAFDIYRNDLSELGLGVKTGIDVPEESLGYRGPTDSRTSGLLLDLVIGQYDSYTPIQVAQYVSTLANGGTRIAPRLVSEGYTVDGEGNKTVTYQNDIEVLDDVSFEETAFEQIHAGYRACVTYSNGLCRAHWSGSDYTVYGKTGSAEVFDYSTGTAIDYANLLNTGWTTSSDSDEVDLVFVSIAPRLNAGAAYYQVPRTVVDAYYEKYE